MMSSPSVFDILLKENIEKDDVTRLQKLIDDGADVDEYKEIDGEEHTPISYLIEYGDDELNDDVFDLDIMEILLQAGATTNLEQVGLDKEYEALCQCIRNKQFGFAKKFLEHGHDPNSFDKDFDINGRFTCLMIAIDAWDYRRPVEMLLQYGANPNNNKGFKVPFDVLLNENNPDYEYEKELMNDLLKDVKNADDVDKNPDIMNALDFYDAKFPALPDRHYGTQADIMLGVLLSHGAKTTNEILGYKKRSEDMSVMHHQSEERTTRRATPPRQTMEEWNRAYEQEANLSTGIPEHQERHFFVQDTTDVVDEYVKHISEEAIEQLDGEIPRVLLDTENFRDVYFEEYETVAYLKESKDNILIVDGQLLMGSTRTNLQQVMDDATKILLECPVEYDYGDEDGYGNIPLYLKMDSVGVTTGVMTNVNQIKNILSSEQQIFVVDTTRDEKRERLVQSLAAFAEISIVGAKHCQEEEPIRIGTLHYVDKEDWMKAKGTDTKGGQKRKTENKKRVKKRGSKKKRVTKKKRATKKKKVTKQGSKIGFKKNVQKTKKQRRVLNSKSK